MKQYVFSTLIFVLAAGGACTAQSDQPTLGELAKKHRQEEKNLAAKVKVFTNEDVATSTPNTQAQSAPAASASSSAPSPLAAASAKSPDKAKDADKNPAATKDAPEVAELKQKLSSYKQEQDGWKQSAKKYEDLLANETSDFRRQVYQEAMQGDKQNVQVFQNKIDQTQSDLAKAEQASVQSH
jgi:hypothetical protein